MKLSSPSTSLFHVAEVSGSNPRPDVAIVGCIANCLTCFVTLGLEVTRAVTLKELRFNKLYYAELGSTRGNNSLNYNAVL